jgi:Lon protease-like protein
MNDDLSALQAFEGQARLFPLPNVVLFPHVMLPLHIFEPRYRQMTADALAGDHLLALVLLRPGWEEDYEGRPPVHSVACLGKIVAEQRLPDGRYNLLLRGLSRGRICDEVSTGQLYRTVRLELFGAEPEPAQAKDSPLRQELGRLTKDWLSAMGSTYQQLGKLLQGDLTLGALTDILSFALPLAMEFKQELLEEIDVEQRVRRLLRHLESQTPPPGTSAAVRAFPPDFSQN